LTHYGSVHGGSGDLVSWKWSSYCWKLAPPPKCLKGLAAILKHIQEENEQSPSSSSLTSSQIIDKESPLTLIFLEPSLTQILLPSGSVNRGVSQTSLTLLGNTCASVALVFPQKQCLAQLDTLLAVLVVIYFHKMLANYFS